MRSDNLFEFVYKSHELLVKGIEHFNFDMLLKLFFNYLDLNLAWIGIVDNDTLSVSKAKGKAVDYVYDESLRAHQIDLLKSNAGSFFVSNDILSDERLGYLKDKAKVYGFNSCFASVSKISDSNYVFFASYSENKDYFDKPIQEILINFSLALKTSIVFNQSQRQLFLLKDIIDESYQGVVITNEKNEITYTNKAFSLITGYTFEEVKGKNPSILKSSYHSKDYYKEMWRKIIHEGHFEGKIYNKRKNGEIYEEMIFIKTIKDENNHIIYFFSFFIDLTELKQAQSKAQYYVYHDPLTKLINQAGFFEQAQRIIENNEAFAIVYIDLDEFSSINVKFGVEKTDNLIKDFSDFLREKIAEPKDIVSRFGSDEFVILKRSVIEQNVVKLVRSLSEKIKQKSFFVDGQEVFLKFSAGIVLYPKDSIEISKLVNFAQAACRKAKQFGKNQCVFFNQSIYEEFTQSFELSNEILRAIEFEEFELYFQPIYDTHSKKITNAEALIRWNHPKRGLLSPYFFIPFAENSYLIEKLDFYVLKKAFEAIKRFKQEGLNIVLSVNLTGRTFLLENFIEQFKNLADANKIDPRLIKIELTESIALSSEDKVRKHMQALNDMGFSFSMDDFGTGYSSVFNLKKFPFSNIKLDQNFIMGSENEEGSAIISSNLLNMLNELNLETTAEGVEDEYLFFIFNHLPCDLLQGYYISKPIPYKEFVVFCKKYSPDNTFLEFIQDRIRVSFKVAKIKYYIYKQYKTLSQLTQPKLTDKQLNDLSSAVALDCRNCEFGKWYYTQYPIYKQIKAFKDIEAFHVDVHNSAKNLVFEKDKERIAQLVYDLKHKTMLLSSAFDNFYLETIKYQRF